MNGKALHNIVILLVSLALIALLRVGYIFFLLAMLPTVIAYYMDNTRTQNTYKTIRACNLAGMLPSAFSVVHYGSIDAALQILIGDPDVWTTTYGAAAVGAVMLFIARWAAYFIIELSSDQRIKTLKETQEQLLAEWGPRIKG
jgi:hypothetical protein